MLLFARGTLGSIQLNEGQCFNTDTVLGTLIPYVNLLCMRQERKATWLETALNFTSSFRSYRRVNTTCLGRKNRSLKVVYISNPCFISDSYKTLWRQDIVFLKTKRGGEKVIIKL
jgi:hypothetical protein